jgi:hypothetical protein
MLFFINFIATHCAVNILGFFLLVVQILEMLVTVLLGLEKFSTFHETAFYCNAIVHTTYMTPQELSSCTRFTTENAITHLPHCPC